VLLHAFPLNARMWEPQLDLAAGGWRIIAPHFRGFDGGDAKPPIVAIDDYVGDVIDVLDSLHVHEAVVVGLSMGGYVALAMVRHTPRYLQALVLADTRPQADTPEGVDGRKRLIALAEKEGAGAIAAEMLPRLLGDTTLRARPAVVESVRGLVTSNSPEAIAGALHAMMTRPDSTALLPKIHIPTLVMVGDEDRVTPPAVAEEMHHAIGGSDFAVVPRAGHLSNLENVEAFNNALADFLAHRV